MRLRFPAAGVLAALALLAPLAAPAAPPPLVPRAVLFGEPQSDYPSLSPDGRWLAWSERGADGVVNLWVRALDRDTSWQVTRDTTRGVHHGWWTPDSQRLLYLDDTDGDENEHVLAVPFTGGPPRDLTPWPGVRCDDVHVDRGHPDVLLVSANRRDPRAFDLWRVPVAGGEPVLEAQNPGDVSDWAVDREFRVRACTALRDTDAATIVRVRDAAGGPWRDLLTWPLADAGFDRTRKVLGFVDDTTLLVQMWAGSNTARIATLGTRDGSLLSVVATDPRFDPAVDETGGTEVPRLLLSPDRTRVQAVCFEGLKTEWRVLDPALRPDFAALGKLAAGATLVILSRDDADRRWVVGLYDDRSMGRYVLWDRIGRRATPLFECAPELRGWTLAEMLPVTVRARDGLELPCYLTLPPGVPAKGLPLVVNPHGGPWFRDHWGWNPEVQWLANRGYAVLQVGFRSTTGFGLRLLNAGDHEYGPGKTHTDLLDAVDWAVKQGLADPKRVGIMGWSFGGYATLAGLAFAPGRFACGVDGVGPSDLATLFESFPPYWSARIERWKRRMGDVRGDAELNRRLSPLHHVDAIRAPLLIGHGANDPRVKLAHSEAMVNAMRAHGLDVTLVVYPDEGHGFGRSENNQDFYGRAEEFFARHLGGRAEPWTAVPGSTAEVR